MEEYNESHQILLNDIEIPDTHDVKVEFIECESLNDIESNDAKLGSIADSFTDEASPTVIIKLEHSTDYDVFGDLPDQADNIPSLEKLESEHLQINLSGDSVSSSDCGNSHDVVSLIEEVSIMNPSSVDNLANSKCTELQRKNSPQNKNEKNKLYSCPYCEKTFTKPFFVEIHMGKHKGERPFKCNKCVKSFMDESTLNKHKKIHAFTEETPLTCPICNKIVNTSGALNRHIKIHNVEKTFECDDCNKTFKDISWLNKHKKEHTGERAKYICTECYMSFNHYSSMIRHKRNHNGERPYNCTSCSKSFSRSSDLNSHQRVHPSE